MRDFRVRKYIASRARPTPSPAGEGSFKASLYYKGEVFLRRLFRQEQAPDLRIRINLKFIVGEDIILPL